MIQWNLSNPTCYVREIVCRDRLGFWIIRFKTHRKWSEGHDNQCRITQGNRLHRSRIRQVLLWITCMQCVVKLNPGYERTMQVSVTSQTAFQVHSIRSLQVGQLTPMAKYSMMNYIPVFVDNIIIVFPCIVVLYIHEYKYLHTKIVTWNYFSVSDGQIIYSRKIMN